MWVQVYLIVGGYAYTGGYTSSIETFSVGDKEWTFDDNSLPKPFGYSFGYAPCATLDNVPYCFGKLTSLFVVSYSSHLGGDDGSASLQFILTWNSTTRGWDNRWNMLTGRHSHGVSVVDVDSKTLDICT